MTPKNWKVAIYENSVLRPLSFVSIIGVAYSLLYQDWLLAILLAIDIYLLGIIGGGILNKNRPFCDLTHPEETTIDTEGEMSLEESTYIGKSMIAVSALAVANTIVLSFIFHVAFIRAVLLVILIWIISFILQFLVTIVFVVIFRGRR